MNLSLFQSLLHSSPAPWLPEATVQYWGMHIAWGAVLGSIVFLWGNRCQFKWPGFAAISVLVWSLWPGFASPSYWLGLAFQSPSLMSVLVCGIWARRSARNMSSAMPGAREIDLTSLLLAGAGILLGWVLLGDTLAWWPVSIYPWGFSTSALALACALAFLLWCFAGHGRGVSASAIGFSVVLVLYVLTRLPSGNLWDALLDPWLWGALHVMGLRVLIRHRLHLRRLSQATRA